MYISAHIEHFVPQMRLGQPSGKPYKPPYDTGGIAIEEKDGDKLLTILSGPSPYHAYIAPIIAAHRAGLPKNFFRIVTNVQSQVPAPLRHLFQARDNKLVAGTIDRWTRTIYMIQTPGLRNATRLEYALHEGVHLFAHPVIPAAGSCPPVCVGTFQRTYGVGFGEGGTQAITEAVMGQQNIRRYYRDAPYEEFTKPMRKLIGVFGVHGFARAYFLGETDAFTKTMESRWGRRWMQVAGLTTLRKPKDACAEIDRLETAHFNWLQKRGPKGDFPAPTRFSKYA